VEYGYDPASQLTTLTYKRAGVVIGGLQYVYDAPATFFATRRPNAS